MSVSWSRRTRIYITDLELMEILLYKFGHFERSKPNPLARLLVGGLVSYEEEKWVKHRRIINPALHLEHLKVVFYSLTCLNAAMNS
uniref:Cytochrome P450 CYP72A219-like n=1 Tax=Nelumbo nucifera TaxID=4432 RepID=A0A822XI50_NELNU|nr:TPA_asm: hypothetical protein HUJ06_019938 [Nelumbo nucifera]